MIKYDKKRKLRKGYNVFLIAFIKKEYDIFYICKGIIEEVPINNKRQVYRIRIVAVGNKPIAGSSNMNQSQLLGLIVTKSARELHTELLSFMSPEAWIEKTYD